MNISGIPSLRGFIFQKKVFIYTVLTELNHISEIQFEGLYDDVAVTNVKNCIFNIEGLKEKYIQVKSGNLTKNIMYDVFTNWMLQDFNKSVNYILISEKNPPLTFSNNISRFYKKTQEELINHPQSNMGRLGGKYENNLLAFKIDFQRFLKNFKSKTFSMDDIDNAIFDAFMNDNGDIQIPTLLETRLNALLNQINDKLEKCICEKQPYALSYKEYSRMRNRLAKLITEDYYELQVSELNVSEEEYRNTINASDEYLVSQLKNLQDNDSFIYDNIVSKIEYSRFRKLYENRNEEINGNETQAKIVYYRNKRNPKVATDYDLYDAVLRESLNFKLLYENPFSRMGCFNYLASSDSLTSPNKIIWRKHDEN